jgi:hypothetical protein
MYRTPISRVEQRGDTREWSLEFLKLYDDRGSGRRLDLRGLPARVHHNVHLVHLGKRHVPVRDGTWRKRDFRGDDVGEEELSR